MERILVIFRHAKAASPEGVPDFDRPLAAKGHDDAPVAGAWLRDAVTAIDLVVCSPAIRARQTWAGAATEFDEAPPVLYDDAVYNASAGDLHAVLTSLPDDVQTAVLIGHNPGLSELVRVLTGRHHNLKTAAIAVAKWDGSWTDAAATSATLIASSVPRA